MNIIVKHIIGGVIFLVFSVGTAFGAFKYGEWWFYVDSYGYHQRSDDNYDRFDACKEVFSNYSLSLSKCEEYKPL